MAGGIPNPCGGCGDVPCSCCIGDTADVAVSAGSGGEGNCYQLTIPDGRIAERVCDEAAVGVALAEGDVVLVCRGGVLQLADYQVVTACEEFNALAPAGGPAVPGDEVVIFDGLTCVRKTITPSDCPPSADPVVLGTPEPVWCGAGELVTSPRPLGVTGDLVLAGWALNLAFLALATPTVMATSGILTVTNPNLDYAMDVMLIGAGGTLEWLGPTGGAWNILVEESVNGAPFAAVYTIYADYSAQGGAGPIQDTHTIPAWNRTYNLIAGGNVTYQWRITITQTVGPINGIVTHSSSRVTAEGVAI